MMGSNHPVLNVKFFCGSLTSFLLADFMDWKEPKTECRSKRLLSYDEKQGVVL